MISLCNSLIRTYEKMFSCDADFRKSIEQSKAINIIYRPHNVFSLFERIYIIYIYVQLIDQCRGVRLRDIGYVEL